ncbi:MAG: acetate--CoA ligase family protein [Deltaproteobacteria bacterium]|nr:acetate--CoA ligase family protein [Deltaproteobacteria bacterium]
MIEPDYHSMKYLFEPRSIAIVGASYNEDKIGYKVTQNIINGGYKGRIYPINPQGGEILGVPVHKKVEDVEQDIDLACIVVPAKYVFDVIKSCAKKNVKNSLIITSGFSEVGNIDEENKIKNYANAHGMRIMGPNMFGLYSYSSSLNATFSPPGIIPGGVAIITQSGALGLAMIGKTAVENMGLSSICSVGNKCDIDEADLLEYLVPHEETKVILMYIEGVRNGERLIQALRKATQKKPVIVIKSGRSKRGAAAAASHTGSLAGADNVFDAIMKQCGVLRAESVRDAFTWCKYISNNPPPSGKEVVIVTNGGGIGVLETDACEKYGVSLYDNTNKLKEIFSTVTPDFGSLKNPIDITGGAQSQHYDEALGAALECDNIHAVLALYCETAVFDSEKLPEMVRRNYENYKKKKKPILFSLFGGQKMEEAVTKLGQENIPVFSNTDDSVSPLGAIYTYKNYLETHSDDIDDVDLDVCAINEIVKKAKDEDRFFLLTNEAQSIMNIAGVPIPRTVIASSLEGAVEGAEGMGYPVVMKVVSKDIIHKSDAGGVAINLLNKKEVVDAYEAIMRSCKIKVPGALIQGIEVAEMVQPGIEIIAGAKIDPSFGPIIMAGLGGIYVEVMKDVAFRAYPLNRREVLSMISEIRSYSLLLGVRGEKTKDIDSLVDINLRLGAIIHKCKGISDIEVNPVVVYEQGSGAKAVDTRILLSRE